MKNFEKRKVIILLMNVKTKNFINKKEFMQILIFSKVFKNI